MRKLMEWRSYRWSRRIWSCATFGWGTNGTLMILEGLMVVFFNESHKCYWWWSFSHPDKVFLRKSCVVSNKKWKLPLFLSPSPLTQKPPCSIFLPLQASTNSIAHPSASLLWTRISHMRPHLTGETHFLLVKNLILEKLESPLILFLF